MKVENLWRMFEESLRKEWSFKKKEAVAEESGLDMIEQCTQNGVSQGILRCIEELEGKNGNTWRRSHEIFCKVQGIDVNTGFGFWVPFSERHPAEDASYLLTFDDGFIATAYWDGDDFELWYDCGEVLAWMPLPEAYEVKAEEEGIDAKSEAEKENDLELKVLNVRVVKPDYADHLPDQIDVETYFHVGQKIKFIDKSLELTTPSNFQVMEIYCTMLCEPYRVIIGLKPLDESFLDLFPNFKNGFYYSDQTYFLERIKCFEGENNEM